MSQENQLDLGIELNVRGTQVFIEPQILEKYPDTFFEAALSGRHRIDHVDGKPYIDRDPDTFE